MRLFFLSTCSPAACTMRAAYRRKISYVCYVFVVVSSRICTQRRMQHEKGRRIPHMSYVMCLLTGLRGSCTRRCTRHMSLQRHDTLVSVGVYVCRDVLHMLVVRSCPLAQTKNPFPLPLLPLRTRPTAISFRLMPVLIVLCLRVMAVLTTQ